MDEAKVALIGCGYWGRNLARNYAALDALACVYDSNAQAAEEVAQQYRVPSSSFEDILASDVTALVIATPAGRHFYFAQAGLTHDKHVFVEKPLCLYPGEARLLCTIARRRKKMLMVGHVLQYHPAFMKLKDLIAQEGIGKLQYIYSHRLSLGKFRNEENILWSFAPHDISMILALAGGEPTYIWTIGGCYLAPYVHDTTTTHLSFASGIDAHIFVSWLHPYKEQKLVVIGDHGMMVFDDTEPWERKLQLYPHQIDISNTPPVAEKAEVQFISLQPAEPLYNECQHFLDCIQTEQTPRTDGEEGLRVLAVLDKAQKSLLVPSS
ncbi:MAG: Gfo/Idh/MocA family oxidoreductase [Holosporales bacterium]|jgi:predicted dehydrogenase|nr:Gfo/Idh/MocA family oxidoreductase [Holosporales bacterium]